MKESFSKPCGGSASTKILLIRVGALGFINISKEYEDTKIIKQKNIE